MIHEVGETEDDRHYIAMEYVDGETLRQVMTSRRMRLDEIFEVAVQTASGLAAAHEVAIVHRDIKPENIMLRRDGYVKVLDFGLAKLTEKKAADVNRSAAMRLETDTGVVMGTSRYMSPEQARGLAVDTRTDIWSLGVVLYEMVTGCAPFTGETESDVLVSILEREPPSLAHYGTRVPRELQRIVGKALSKDTERRYQTIAELLIDLKRIRSGQRPSSRFTARRLSLFTAATLVLIVGGSIWFYGSHQTAKSVLPPMKVVPFTSFPGAEYTPAFSPDGNQIAFNWNGEKDDNGDIYVKQIGAEKPLRLTFDAARDFAPVWSPNGQKIAFNRFSETETAIFVVPALGGAERKLLTLGPNPGWPGLPTLAWSPDGKFIAFTYKAQKEQPFKIFLLSPDTFERHALTSPAAENVGDFNPAFSPDGKSVAFARQSSGSLADIYVVPITGGEPSRLTFDNASLAGLAFTENGREIIFSSSRADGGSSEYRHVQIASEYSNLWRIPTSGGTAERVRIGGDAYFPNISRLGNRLAYVQTPPEDENIYRIELSDRTVSNNPPIKLIGSTRGDGGPQFAPDGRRIAFHSDRSGESEIWICDREGTNPVQVTTLKYADTPRWSPDGQQIAFVYRVEAGHGARGDIYAISAEGGRPRPIATGDSDDILPSWSRDGKWVYFSSNRTGDQQVWKAPAQGGDAVQVTRRGGGVAWEAADGKYVYYVKWFPAQGIWRVPVDGGEELQVLDSFRSENFADWAVVNDGLYFINPDAKDGVAIEFFNFASRKVRQVAGLGKIHTNINCIAVSPDRRQLLYSQNDQSGADIILVENFQ